MLVTVLKHFPYAADGVNSVMLEEGAKVDVRDGLIAGLLDAGLIAVFASADMPLDQSPAPADSGRDSAGSIGAEDRAPAPPDPTPPAEAIAPSPLRGRRSRG